ncbi:MULTISPECIES: DUF4349 domain-containing protein [unclassified Chryseobacterium]|uniref:DUF4349 domain-containing protein n=1 Tax=unclassified Chryseobacterium TaxID=2593645 RepID=UPI00100A553B|nr:MULTISPECIES: DUF4349 domain-containing protein [unclassified Chryseobacterium]RXM53451.1 hypothetical protein BOQ64_03570 [Chryseobacterium sp. CH25]RXM65347.1 hypothetical protein BOQ60_05920 [Chryseobacterium sp. CH1]
MRTLLLPLLFLAFINCSKSGGDNLSANADLTEIIEEQAPLNKASLINAKTDDASSNEPNSNKTDTLSRKIIKNGNMRIQVGEIKKAQTLVNGILKKSNAYIQKEEFQNTDIDENLDLTIRVPHKNFDTLVNSFSDGVGSVLSKNISSDDVTEEYTDVSIKLANKKIYLEKYRDMLKSATTTKDMLEIQEKIRGLEDEIDVAEGRLRFIDDRVNYSTLNLSLYKEKVRSSTTSKIGFGSRFVDSLTEGWNSFVAFLLGIISFWPFFLLIPLVIFLWKKWKKRKQ